MIHGLEAYRWMLLIINLISGERGVHEVGERCKPSKALAAIRGPSSVFEMS